MNSLQTKIEPKFIDIPKEQEDGIKYGNAHINQELLDLHKNETTLCSTMFAIETAVAVNPRSHLSKSALGRVQF